MHLSLRPYAINYFYILTSEVQQRMQMKTDLDALERTKDDEAKKFKGHNIEFDFHILIKIKEAMVDVSSNCMELVLKVSQLVRTN